MKSESIISAVQSVTGKWKKHRKAEERDSSVKGRRKYIYSERVNFSGVAAMVLPVAYDHASGGGQYTVSQRQLYYAAREAFKVRTGREIEYSYFSQTILRQYLNRHNPDWKITADPRGTFSIPNGDQESRIPVGTIQIDDYLSSCCSVELIESISIPVQYPSSESGVRYGAVLYIEKEGFGPLFAEAKIAERFDLAILSCKGQSVVAARKLVDEICRVDGGVPLFVVHDFDKYGFEIASSLTQVSDAASMADRVAYNFENEINVTDFGLRLDDVNKFNLASEHCKFDPRWSCPEGATDAEFDYLRSGRRVELNAFTAPQFIQWLEEKLTKHLPQRLLPDDAALEPAYRRAITLATINEQLKRIIDQAMKASADAKIPAELRCNVQAEMKKTGEQWDVALYRMIESQI